ncbi:MAG: radical SAM protein [Chloroflexaceae bacterium]|nr:radical SAM protein [Chloroflexaceae bacterium]
MHTREPIVYDLAGFGRLFLTVRPFSLTISVNHQSIFSFDRDGRLIGAFLNGVHYKRGLQNDVLKKAVHTDRSTTLEVLEPAERDALLSAIGHQTDAIKQALEPHLEQATRAWFDAILAWDVTSLEAERTRFNAIYRPVSILPPDHYLAVVLQATEGCTWNQCTFCDFYRDRRFHMKSVQEFRQHIAAVKAFFGRSLGLRKSIFLADANALIIPQRRLVELLGSVHESFSIGAGGGGNQGDEHTRFEGIYSFLDIFGAERKTLSDYAELAALGLKRIYIGLETGDTTLFEWLNKPGSPQACIDAVQTIKATGISVGIIVLAGVGGNWRFQEHIDQTLQTLHAMSLDQSDIVYLSPIVTIADSAYAQQMHRLGIATPAPAEIQAQLQQFKTRLYRQHQQRPRVTLYDIRAWIY